MEQLVLAKITKVRMHVFLNKNRIVYRSSKAAKSAKKIFKKSFPKGLFLCLNDLFGLIKGLLLQTESILPLAKIKL